MNHIQSQGGGDHGPFGRFVFRRDVVRARITDATGDTNTTSMDSRVGSMAALVLGLPNNLGKNTLALAPFQTKGKQFGLYVRDRWQITPKFTLNIGTRWEYFPMPTRSGGNG